MIIEWYTVIFQIINFLILVFLLRHFLYGPITRNMDEREQKIVQREDDALAQKKEAEAESRSYSLKLEQLQQQEEEILEKARATAVAEKRELLQKARQEVEETKRRWEDAFTREKETFGRELRRRMGQQACTIARRCLQDLADAQIEALVWKLFLAKLSNLLEKEHSALQKEISDSDYKLTLRSAFTPTDDNIKQLKLKLHHILPESTTELNLSVEKDPTLICGLELNVGGFAIAWNVNTYLQDIEREIFKDLKQAETTELTEEVSGSGEQEG